MDASEARLSTDVCPDDLPVGFADSRKGREMYLKHRIDLAATPEIRKKFEAILEREREDRFATLLFVPEDDVLYDVGIEYYGEFICSLNTADRLLREQTITVRGEPGHVEVATRYTNGVQMRWLAE